MIQVQIASQVTAEGVSGVRWVLVETQETHLSVDPDAAAALVQDATVAVAPPRSAGSPTASSLQLGALKLVVICLGLGAALWTAQVQVGPPGAARMQPPAPAAQMPQVTPATQGHGGAAVLSVPPALPRPLPPAAMPGGASPPPPAASGGLPRLTAAL